MSEYDEHLLTAAKVRELADGDLDGSAEVSPLTGLVDDEDVPVVTFLEAMSDGSWRNTELGAAVASGLASDRANRAVSEGNASVLANLTGVTETEYDGSSLTVTARIIEAIENDGAPSFWSVAGNPNTGKTNTMVKLVEVADRAPIMGDGPLVLSNAESWDRVDLVVKSMHDLMVQLLEHRDEPKIVVIDEVSTHFDARTHRQEVAEQWTPAAKRFAKVGVEMCGLICHTGKDYHPEAKRLTTTAIWKESKTEAMFYEQWPGDSDKPLEPMFSESIRRFEKATGYDPSDAAPWDWNLSSDLFQRDLGWDGMLKALRSGGGEI